VLWLLNGFVFTAQGFHDRKGANHFSPYGTPIKTIHTPFDNTTFYTPWFNPIDHGVCRFSVYQGSRLSWIR